VRNADLDQLHDLKHGLKFGEDGAYANATFGVSKQDLGDFISYLESQGHSVESVMDHDLYSKTTVVDMADVQPVRPPLEDAQPQGVVDYAEKPEWVSETGFQAHSQDGKHFKSSGGGVNE
jgi:hypothetical protein